MENRLRRNLTLKSWRCIFLFVVFSSHDKTVRCGGRQPVEGVGRAAAAESDGSACRDLAGGGTLCEGHSYWLSTSGGHRHIKENWHRTTAGGCCDTVAHNHDHTTAFSPTGYFEAGMKVFRNRLGILFRPHTESAMRFCLIFPYSASRPTTIQTHN